MAKPRTFSESKFNRPQVRVGLTFRYEFAAFRFKNALSRYFSQHTKANFNRNQPRIPKDNPGGGQWTSDGGVDVTTFDGFLTGIATIDNISQALSDTLL